MWCKKPASPDDVCTTTTNPAMSNNRIPAGNSENALTACLKVTGKTFGSVLPPHFPGYTATETVSPTALSVSAGTHAHRMHRLTGAALFPRVLCTLSCAVSYWRFSGTLLHFLISFPTVVFFSLFHNWTFVSPSISKKHLIWFLSHGQQPRRLKKLFLTCHVNTSAPRYISLLLVLQNSVEPFPSWMLYFLTIYIIIYTLITSMHRMFFCSMHRFVLYCSNWRRWNIFLSSSLCTKRQPSWTQNKFLIHSLP